MGCKPIALPLRWFESNPAHWLARRGRALVSTGPATRASEHPLHQDDVEPAAELAADLALSAHLLEAAGRVQGDRRVVVADDAADHGVEAVVACQLRRDRRGAAARRPSRAGRAGRRRSPRPSWRTRAGTGTATATRSRRRRRRRRRRRSPGGRPSARRSRRAARRGTGPQIEGHGRLEHLDVVDRAQRIGVAPLDEAGPVLVGRRHGGDATQRAAAGRACSANLSGFAPLAQLAEHFHGKEGVYGSSP